MKKFNLRGRFGRADAWGVGLAVVFTDGIVAALGPWFVEVDW